MKKTEGVKIAECPECNSPIMDNHPVGDAWCLSCRSALPVEILESLHASHTAQQQRIISNQLEAESFRTQGDGDKCSACSTPLDSDARFCPACRTPVIVKSSSVCPNCGKPVSLESRFCKYCAFDLKKPITALQGNFAGKQGASPARAFLIILIGMGGLALIIALLNKGSSGSYQGGSTSSSPTSSTSIQPMPQRIWRNKLGMEFVFIPPGSFMMGSENGDADERPVHRVIISKGFFMGRYEVTQAHWYALMGGNSSHFRGNSLIGRSGQSRCILPEPSRFGDDNLPVDQMSWNNTQEFIQRMNQFNDSYIYRLPTEAEWEYAARAGTTGDYVASLDSMAWYSDNSDNQTHPVGTKQPNAFGLYDMLGNVWEWCQDWYDENYYRNSPSVDPQGPINGKSRVYRGGQYGMTAFGLRPSNRDWGGLDGCNTGLNGFRVVAIPRGGTGLE